MKEAKDAEGKMVKVGDWVEFKCDIEQIGKVVAISRAWSGRVDFTLEADGGFAGEYIGGQTRASIEADRCYLI